MAWLDGRQRLCREGDANMGAGNAGKGGACWRGPTENKGFAGRATPTWAPAAVIIPPVANEERTVSPSHVEEVKEKGEAAAHELRLLRPLLA